MNPSRNEPKAVSAESRVKNSWNQSPFGSLRLWWNGLLFPIPCSGVCFSSPGVLLAYGPGVMTYANGDRYEGRWNDDKMDEHGGPAPHLRSMDGMEQQDSALVI